MILAGLTCLAMVLLPVLIPDGKMYAMLAGVAGGVLVLLWWLFFSRAPWVERVGAVVLMVAAVALTRLVVDPSISNAGMGMMLPMFSIPLLSLALVVWAVASRRLPSGTRRASLVAAIVLACSVFTLLRTGGVSGGGGAELHWRWTPTAEERLLAQAANEPDPVPVVAAPAPAPAVPSTPESAAPTVTTITPENPIADPVGDAPAAGDTPAPAGVVPVRRATWPGFRGPGRDAVIGVRGSPPTGRRLLRSSYGAGRSGRAGPRLR